MKRVTLPAFLVYTLLISIMIIVGIFFFAMKDGNACISDPLVYGVQKATTDQTGDITCSCKFSSPEYSTLYFDVNGMSTEPELYDLLG